ncbi:MAG: hypothetical protein KDC61_06800 [Saprospiraceae bacterium]|nr:hypothetical protein [Saprospiraceae bacterium]
MTAGAGASFFRLCFILAAENDLLQTADCQPEVWCVLFAAKKSAKKSLTFFVFKNSLF